MPLQGGGDQCTGFGARGCLREVVTFLVRFAWQLLYVLLLQGHRQLHHGIHALEEGSAAFGVFADPMGDACCGLHGMGRQHISQWRIGGAAEVKRGGDEKEPSLANVFTHGRMAPAARNRRAVRMRGSPISAVGSSLSMASSKVMPRSSLLALPAQSYGSSARK